MKITHREPIAFNVACINSKSFFKNAGFLEIGFFWKIKLRKAALHFVFPPACFLKAKLWPVQSIVVLQTCRAQSPDFWPARTEKNGSCRIKEAWFLRLFSWTFFKFISDFFALFCYFFWLSFIIFQPNNRHSIAWISYLIKNITIVPLAIRKYILFHPYK